MYHLKIIKKIINSGEKDKEKEKEEEKEEPDRGFLSYKTNAYKVIIIILYIII